MAFVRNAFVLFLALMEMVDMAIGAAIIYLGVYLYQKFNGVSSGDLNVSTFYYFGIGCMVFGSIIVVLALVGLFRVCKITRYGLLSEMVKAVVYILIITAGLIGINLYLAQLIIFITSIYTTEYQSTWSFIETLFSCCGPETSNCGSTPQCDDVLITLLLEGEQYYNIVGGVLLGVEVLVLIATVYLLRTQQYIDAEGLEPVSFEMAPMSAPPPPAYYAPSSKV